MKITFSGSAEEIAAAIRAVAGVGEVQIRVAEPAWRKMAEEVAQEMKGLADKIRPGTEATAEPKPEPTEQRIKREDVRLEVGDEVRHATSGDTEKHWFIVEHFTDRRFPLWSYVAMNSSGVTNIPKDVPPVTHFRRNGITYTIED